MNSKLLEQNDGSTTNGFIMVKSSLSKKFVNAYERYEWFHDWYIDKLEYLTSKNHSRDSFCLHISRSNYWPHRIDKRILLTFYGVDSIFIKVSKVSEIPLYDKDEYRYDSWESVDDHRIHYKLHMLSSSVVELTCKGVKLDVER